MLPITQLAAAYDQLEKLSGLMRDSHLDPKDASLAIVFLDMDKSQIACVRLTEARQMELLARLNATRAVVLGVVFAILDRERARIVKKIVPFIRDEQAIAWLHDCVDGRGAGRNWLQEFTSPNSESQEGKP